MWAALINSGWPATEARVLDTTVHPRSSRTSTIWAGVTDDTRVGRMVAVIVIRLATGP